MVRTVSWTGLVIVAGAAAGVSIGTNQLVQDKAGGVYDSIMTGMGS